MCTKILLYYNLEGVVLNAMKKVPIIKTCAYDLNTVIYIDGDEDSSSFWNTIDLDSHTHRISLNEDKNTELRNDWLTPLEVEEKSRCELRSKKIRASFNPSTTAYIPPNDTAKSMILSNEIPNTNDTSNIPINSEFTDTSSVNS